MFCAACGCFHSDAPPIVDPGGLAVQQVRIIREICRMRGLGSTSDRELGLVEICALLGEEWLRRSDLLGLFGSELVALSGKRWPASDG